MLRGFAGALGSFLVGLGLLIAERSGGWFDRFAFVTGDIYLPLVPVLGAGIYLMLSRRMIALAGWAIGVALCGAMVGGVIYWLSSDTLDLPS